MPPSLVFTRLFGSGFAGLGNTEIRVRSMATLPKNAAEWILNVNPRAVLAIARMKAEEGGSDFRGGRSPTATGEQPNLQRKLPDGQIVRHNLSPAYVVGDYFPPQGTFDEGHLSDVLDDQLEVFLHGFRLGGNALAAEN
jgi:hypothetical protein